MRSKPVNSLLPFGQLLRATDLNLFRGLYKVLAALCVMIIFCCYLYPQICFMSSACKAENSNEEQVASVIKPELDCHLIIEY